jgi:integrase
MRALRTILNFHQGDDESYLNPVRILSRRREWYKVDSRRTLIKNSDLPAWHKAVTGLDNDIMRDYLLLLLFTGLRRNEAATLKWKQIDFIEPSFTVVDTKNKLPHTLPLSEYLFNLLNDRKEGLKTELAEAQAAMLNYEMLNQRQQQTASNRLAMAEKRAASLYVFPGEGKTGFINEPRRAIDSVIESTGISFSCHDLRRTFATIAESLDLSRYTVKALLNHKQQESDVTSGYIILNVDRLREPMKKITNAILERIKVQHGQVINIQAVKRG